MQNLRPACGLSLGAVAGSPLICMQNRPMADVIPLAPQGLTDQVAARLRTMLIEGRIPPGAKLNERVLAGELASSQVLFEGNDGQLYKKIGRASCRERV